MSGAEVATSETDRVRWDPGKERVNPVRGGAGCSVLHFDTDTCLLRAPREDFLF